MPVFSKSWVMSASLTVGAVVELNGALELTQFDEVPVKAKLFRVPLYPFEVPSFRVVTPALLPSAVPWLKS